MIQSRSMILTALAASSLLASNAFSQTIGFTTVPGGFNASSIALPEGFAGGLGADPTDDRIVYASVGAFTDNKLAKVDLESASSRIVAQGPFGSIGGIAVLSATEMVLVDNSNAAGGPPDDTILIARDTNGDGDFDDAGEIEELIAPILTPGNWTGVQARTVPPGDPSGIPSGSVVIQTADGGGGSELLVVADPLVAPAYRPAASAYFSGFDFNGGFDFDSQGRLLMGTATGSFVGNVIALVNTNLDENIDPGEFHTIVSGGGLPFGKSDLAIDAEDEVYCTSGGFIDSFPIPADPLTGSATPANFAVTDSGFLSAILFNSKTRPFEPGVGAAGASLIASGFTGGFEQATNLLVLTPSQSLEVGEWNLYK